MSNSCANESTAADGFSVFPPSAVARLAELEAADQAAQIQTPDAKNFHDFLTRFAQVLRRDGSVGPFTFEGRKPLRILVEWFDKVLDNTLHGKTVVIDGHTFQPGQLKAALIVGAGGAQFGKTIWELNGMVFVNAILFRNAANFLPDGPKVDEIVDQKQRPNTIDLYPWLAQMIRLGKTENASGRSVNRKASYQVTDGQRTAFGNFVGMHRPPTSFTIDVAFVDEVDDVKKRHLGYISGRMTDSPVALSVFIGTQRLAGAGQNERLNSSSSHRAIYTCPDCGHEQNLEENFPRSIRLAGEPIQPEDGFDRAGRYYCACVECGAEIDRDDFDAVPQHPHRIAEAKLGLRVSQLNISAIDLNEIVGAWYAALEDPSGEALAAFYCDRIALPKAGAAQPITDAILKRARGLTAEIAKSAKIYNKTSAPAGGRGKRKPSKGVPPSTDAIASHAAGAAKTHPSSFIPQPYNMGLAPGEHPRFAGMDMGPRCWFWADEIESPESSPMVWAEMIASGQAAQRVPLLMDELNIQTLFLDAAGEPELTKSIVMSLNGIADYRPPVMSPADLHKQHLSNLPSQPSTLTAQLRWDPIQSKWFGLRAAAVLFVAGEAKGLRQEIGITNDGRIYPLIKCNRAESIQTAVNDFLTPEEGVIELLGNAEPSTKNQERRTRIHPRARLPQTAIGVGASMATIDTHLLNLRKEKDAHGVEKWVDKVENHLALAKVYARLAAMLGETTQRQPFASARVTRPPRGLRKSRRQSRIGAI